MCGVAAAPVPALHGQEAADHVTMGIAANEAHDLSTALRHFQAALARTPPTMRPTGAAR